MEEINLYIGGQIRKYRKAGRMTLQQLADAIHKSRATVCKYESGEISIDIATLYDIAQALGVPFSQLASYRPSLPVQETPAVGTIQKGPFFRAKRLYFYYYDGRYKRLKDGVIDIHGQSGPSLYEASFTLSSVTSNGRGGEFYYTGNVLYSDMLIRFTFVNQLNPLEEDLLYIFNPLQMRDDTDGLLCGISSADLMPCAFRCLVTLTPQALDEELRRRLLFSQKDLRRWAQLNMLLIGNNGV
ncbi:helix-turn-helix transcriptional regulator [Oscillibacter valericigenes]|nr:helix-turn-helix transcriptional regulator [Oscillibacter valericigenes]